MIKRAAYLGSSGLCGFFSMNFLAIGVQQRSPVILAVSAGFGLASVEMGKKVFERKPKKTDDTPQK